MYIKLSISSLFFLCFACFSCVLDERAQCNSTEELRMGFVSFGVITDIYKDSSSHGAIKFIVMQQDGKEKFYWFGPSGSGFGRLIKTAQIGDTLIKKKGTLNYIIKKENGVLDTFRLSDCEASNYPSKNP